jgi:hypothetical protein
MKMLYGKGGETMETERMITFHIFNGTKAVPVPEKYVNYYIEKAQYPVDDRRAEYLAVSSGGTKDDTVEKLAKDIIDGLLDEADFQEKALRYAHKIRELGGFEGLD